MSGLLWTPHFFKASAGSPGAPPRSGQPVVLAGHQGEPAPQMQARPSDLAAAAVAMDTGVPSIGGAAWGGATREPHPLAPGALLGLESLGHCTPGWNKCWAPFLQFYFVVVWGHT